MSMHSSLVSRFRGALLGAAVGESLGINCQNHPIAERSRSKVETWAFQPLPELSQRRAIATQVQRLTGQLPAEEQSETWPPEDGLTLIWLLPKMLIGFDYPQSAQLEAYPWLMQIAARSTQLDGQLMHQVMALILRGCPPHQLTEQLVAIWHDTPEGTQIHNRLWQVQTLVESGFGLITARQELATRSLIEDPTASMVVPIALYGFLCTPDDARLALLRTAQLDDQTRLTCALVGAMVGAWGGVDAIPVAWRQRIGSAHEPSALLSLWQVSSESDLFKQADQLAAAWAGVYHPMGDRAIAAPVMTSLPR